MSEYRGYKGKSLQFLQKNNVKVGEFIKITTDLTYTGILMPRYEYGDDKHVVLKLKNGYNIGIEIYKIKQVRHVESEKISKEEHVKKEPNVTLPKVLLLSTGGTIASKVDYRTGGVTPALSAADLNSIVPELNDIANIETEVLFSEYSENLLPIHWKQIAEKLDSYSKSDYKGIVIAHGTDTMQYTAAFLCFALAGFPIPVALVGSQRSSDRPSSDATTNLIAATRFVVNSDRKGIFVVMHFDENDETVACHIGTRVRKNHTSKRGAFKTIGDKPAFLVMDEKIISNIEQDIFKQEGYMPKINFNNSVYLVKYYPGYDTKLIDNMIKNECKAIIFEGTGLGHIGRTMYDSVKKAKQNGVFLGMTSQCIEGKVRMTVYESGRDLLQMGVIPLSDMIPETALVKAMWASGNFDNEKDIEKIMLKNIASEFSD